MKILQISDLHFCNEDLKPSLKAFVKDVSSVFPRLELELHFADSGVLDALHRLIIETNPDVIVITGDVTTFGDEKSFEDAHQWLNKLIPREGGGVRNFIITPGNHDALIDHFSALKQMYEEKLGWLSRKWLDPFLPLKSIEKHLSKTWQKSDFLKNFRAFIDKNAMYNNKQRTFQTNEHGHYNVMICPFLTVSNDPFWMNFGDARKEAWDSLNSQLSDASYNNDRTLKIVVAHHNPVSSPGVIESKSTFAYNSMPGGTHFLQTLQQKGVDILLHGHQHQSALFSYDFSLSTFGPSFTVGCPSSSAATDGGCNLLEIDDIHHVKFTEYKYSTTNGFETSGVKELPLEQHCPRDPKTTAARYEIKRYCYGENPDEMWSELQNPGTKLVYMSGRHLKEAKLNQFKALRDLLNDEKTKTKIRILTNNPKLLESIASSTGEFKHDLWGTKESLEALALSAKGSIDSIKGFIGTLSTEQQNRVDLRLSHTLLPFGAFVRDADQLWGKMTVRILPVGAYGLIDAPVFRLDRRSDEVQYDYYLRHLKILFLKGLHEAGGLTDDSDLRQGMEDVL